MLTRYLAKELGPRNFTVNVAAPGTIETDFGGGVVRDNADVNRFIASQTALGRVACQMILGGLSPCYCPKIAVGSTVKEWKSQAEYIFESRAGICTDLTIYCNY